MKKNIIFFIIISCLIFLLSCNDVDNDTCDCVLCNRGSSEANRISMIRLISNPENYHGKRVRIIGVGSIGSANGAIYLSKDDRQHRIHENGFFISFTRNEFINESHAEYNGRFVIVEGYFDMYNTGHMGLLSGSIYNITRYDLWERDREEELLPSED